MVTQMPQTSNDDNSYSWDCGTTLTRGLVGQLLLVGLYVCMFGHGSETYNQIR